MNKHVKFSWAWNNYPAQLDPSMDRKRAARLLWAWRKTSRAKTSHGTIRRALVRVSAGVYRVTQLDCYPQESGTMFIHR
jgi:hypothetical protein